MSEMQFVQPSQIEKELSKIWEALSSPAEGKNRRMRACLFNLILVTDKNARAAYIRGIAEKVIEKFFAAELKCKIILADFFAIAGLSLAFSFARASLGTFNLIAFLIFLIAGIDGLPHAAVGVPKIGFVDVFDRDGNFFSAIHIGDRAPFDGARHSFLNLPLVATQKALAIGGGFVFSLYSSVDQMNQSVLPN